MPVVTINNKDYEVPEGITIIQACELADIEIPRFCYHERLEIAGNCRMCLVEVAGGPPKPVASCAMPIANGMKVFTDTPMVKKAREGVMEFLLANHPLDCPICDQGGECDLQDQAYQYGKDRSHYHENKRAVKDKDFGPLIKTSMNRCIHCTRCVRFSTEIAGTSEMGAIGRGETMEITSYLEKNITSELSANVIDLCPVGALTSKPYAFEYRSWELKKTETIDVMDALCSNIRIDSRGLEVIRILPRLNEEINEEWISDKTRFCYDGLKYQRLDSAYIQENGRFSKIDFARAIKLVSEKLQNCKTDEVAALSGPLSAAEDIFAAKKLLQKLDSTIFECRLNDEKIDYKDQSSYLFNTTIAGIEESDACLLIGVNPKKDAPVLNARIRKRLKYKGFKVAAIGLEEGIDLSYPYENLGTNLEELEKILEGKSEFSKVLKNAKKPMLIIGQDAISEKNGEEILNLAKKIAEKFNFIQSDFNGFNFLSKSTGLINGLELGFVSDLGISKILKKTADHEIKVVFLLGVDESIDFEKLKNCFVVYIGSHGDVGARYADIILPSAAYSEKEVTYVNLEGRAQKTTRVIFPLKDAKEETQIISEIAKSLNLDLGFKNAEELHKLMAEYNKVFAESDKIHVRIWQKAADLKDANFNRNLKVKNYDFYLTNAIARSSPTLNKCSKAAS